MKEMSFNDFGISNDILRALDDLGFKKPTEVQEKAIPKVVSKKDVIIKADTGSGKTGAFGIPLCQTIDRNEKSPQVLILTPTRELAVQVMTEVGNIGRYRKVRCTAVYGKHPIRIEIAELKQRVHMIAGTPGRVFAHIEQENFDLSKIKYLVIDEADEMLNMGFIDQVEKIIKKLPKDRVTLLFSATMPEKIQKICERHMKNPERIDIASKESSLNKIKQSYISVNDDSKKEVLRDIIYAKKPESCIVFCNTRQTVRDVQRSLKKNKFFVEGLHGGMEQDIRLQTIKDFKRGRYHFLVSTDVAARGIHIDDISLVVNYDIPVEKESYVHRIGRTGRAGKGGEALTFVTDRQDRLLQEIIEFAEVEIEKVERPLLKDKNSNKVEAEKKYSVKPKGKKDKADKLNKSIIRIRINSGKDKKLRAIDIIGSLCSLDDMTNDDIGIVDIQKSCSYVEIFGGKGNMVLRELESLKIKGRTRSFKKVAHK